MRSSSRIVSPVRWWGVTLLCCWALGCCSGCISKGKAEAQSKAAFLAGQQQAMQNLQQQLRNPTVTLVGAFRNRTVPWTQDLTLAKAIVEAGYLGKEDPTEIFLVRNGQATRVDPKLLLNGQDMPLEAADIIQIK